MLSASQIAFVREHMDDDCVQLLLHAGRYPQVDMPLMVSQIQALQKIKTKLPSWAAAMEVFYPKALSLEQCSCEQTALYKQRFSPLHVVDLTGGLGADSWAFSCSGAKVTYVERDPELCAVARHNFSVLGCRNIDVCCHAAQDYLSGARLLPHRPDLLYLDPDRRSARGKRLYALEDCSPNVLEIKEELLSWVPKILLKLSPMEDLTQVLRMLPETTQIHVLSVKNECKELLLLLERPSLDSVDKVHVFCWDYSPQKGECVFDFYWGEEIHVRDLYAADPEMSEAPSLQVSCYLFEPNAAMMKAGAFSLPARHYHLCPLHRHSHLYYSPFPCPSFPGRQFRIEEIIPMSSSYLKHMGKLFPSAHLAVRNFPLSVDQWRKKTGIREGGDDYFFGTTLCRQGRDERIILHTKKIG